MYGVYVRCLLELPYIPTEALSWPQEIHPLFILCYTYLIVPYTQHLQYVLCHMYVYTQGLRRRVKFNLQSFFVKVVRSFEDLV